MTNGKKCVTPIEKTEALNKFFVSVFTKEDVENIPEPPQYNVGEVLTTINITPEIVLGKLKTLNPNKTPGHNQWHPYFLRELAEDLCIPLSILLNKSLKESKSIQECVYDRMEPTGSKPARLWFG